MSNPEIAYNNLVSEYLKIKESEWVQMNRKREVIVGESLQLASYATEDIEEFRTISRFDITLITSLSDRIDGFIHADNDDFFADTNHNEAVMAWNKIKEDAEPMVKKILGRRKTIAQEEGDLSMVKEMNRLSRGNGRIVITRAFMRLAQIAHTDAEKLATIGIDAPFLEQFFAMNTQVQAIAAVFAQPLTETVEKKKMLFRSYTYLMQAVNQIKKYGMTLFKGTDREKYYKSESLKHHNAGRRVSNSNI